jgi:ABC-type multidrug transport system fused ATPase/permease subunit
LAVQNGMVGVVPGLLEALGTAAVLSIGGLRVIEGAMTVGTLLAMQILLGSFMRPLSGLMGLFSQVQQAQGDLNRISELVAPPVEGPAVTGKPGPSIGPPETMTLAGGDRWLYAIDGVRLLQINLGTLRERVIAEMGESGRKLSVSEDGLNAVFAEKAGAMTRLRFTPTGKPGLQTVAEFEGVLTEVGVRPKRARPGGWCKRRGGGVARKEPVGRLECNAASLCFPGFPQP